MVRDAFLEAAGERLERDDIRSNPMGAPGEDLLFSPAARRLFPFSIECKNVEKLNIWSAIDQCLENTGNHEPLVAFKKNGKEPYIAIRLEKFLEYFKTVNIHGKEGPE